MRETWDLTWAQELCIYMFVWMAKFGAAYGVRTGIHVGVDVFINMLGVERRHKVILFGLLCGALFTGIVGSLGAYLVWHIGQIGQVSQDLEVPMWLVYLCVPLGSYLMCFRFLQVAWVFQHNGELPSHDHAEVEGLADEGKPAETPDVMLPNAAEADEPHPQAGRMFSQLLIAVPVLLVALCFAGKFGLVDLGPAARGSLIFALLFA